jgi:N4-(beta-N-acetylglucosaminyl)-L-asparaginase
MSSRRNFLKKAGQNVIGLAAGASFSQTQSFNSFLPIDEKNGPIILSTWNNAEANQAAWDKLASGKSLLDAIEAGVKIPEADINDTSVGFGGYPDDTGQVTLDACIMDHAGNAGSVVYLKDIAHPISVARKVMENTAHVILAGHGAQQFAVENGFKKKNLLSKNAAESYLKFQAEKKKLPINADQHDTIGMIALDASANLSGGCSTSGWAFKKNGRVGDSPIIGAGLYVDNEIGAATATGLGELVLKTLGSFLIVELMRLGYPPKIACQRAVERIIAKYEAKDQQVGYIALNKYGQFGAYSIREGFNFTCTKNGESTVLKADSYAK